MGNPEDAHGYLISLLKGNVCTRSLSFNDLKWCEEVCVCVLLLRNQFIYPSSVMIFLHSICIILGLVTS